LTVRGDRPRLAEGRASPLIFVLISLPDLGALMAAT
jgi:hypothetical protein